MSGPALRLTPIGWGINWKAEVGSVAMDISGTIWAVSRKGLPGMEGDFAEYVRTNTNSAELVPVVPQRVTDTRTLAGRARIVNPVSNFFLTGINPLVDHISVHAQQTTHVILDVVAFVVASGSVNPSILPAGGELAAEDRRARLARRTKPSWAK